MTSPSGPAGPISADAAGTVVALDIDEARRELESQAGDEAGGVAPG